MVSGDWLGRNQVSGLMVLFGGVVERGAPLCVCDAVRFTPENPRI